MQVGDLQRDPPGAGIPVPFPVSVVLDLAQRRTPFAAPMRSSTSTATIRSAAKASIARTRSLSARWSYARKLVTA